ncbi:hypothetical protein [Amycolatopsis magusensis]
MHRRFDKYRLHGEWFDFGNLDPVEQVERALREIRG